MGDRVCAGISPLLTFCEMYSPLQTKEKDMFIKKITPAFIYKKHKELLSAELQTSVSINYKCSFR